MKSLLVLALLFAVVASNDAFIIVSAFVGLAFIVGDSGEQKKGVN
jgi:hypothetical protein